MSEIRTKPANRKYRDNFDRVFKKTKRSRNMNMENDERDYVDWGEFNTTVCCNNDPNFVGG
jgi:hypothetical protein